MMLILACLLATTAAVCSSLLQAPPTSSLLDLIAKAETLDQQRAISRLLDVIARRMLATGVIGVVALVGAVLLGWHSL